MYGAISRPNRAAQILTPAESPNESQLKFKILNKSRRAQLYMIDDGVITKMHIGFIGGIGPATTDFY